MHAVRENLSAYLQLTAAMSTVGTSVVVGKLIVENFPLFLANGLGLAVGSAILVPLLLRREGGFRAVGGQDFLGLVLQALTGVFLFRVLLLYGLTLTTLSRAASSPARPRLVIGLISFAFLKDRPSSRSIVGILLAVAGILAINVLREGPGGEDGAASLLGNLLVFGAVVGEALCTIFAKAASARVTPLATATAASVLALLMFLPLSLYEAASFDFSAVSFVEWTPVLYYGVFVTVLAFVLWFGGVSKVPASTAVFTGVLPVSAVLLSYIVLGEPFLSSHLVGVICVLSAILLIAQQRPTKTEVIDSDPLG